MYQQLLAQTDIEFELLYDAKTWLVLQEWTCDKPILYLHNGGISGNASMLARYRRLGHTT
jgi:1-aminocyclopropane-1-carboxylate deaminase/D-cysteine desulfhydrase-like pyridoxal-dependent ACC family enzyme